MSSNFSLYAVPLYWFVSQWPHFYGLQIAKAANNGKWNNTNPNSFVWQNKLQTSLPKAILAKYERCKAAHNNCMASFPVFATAILAGNLAALDNTTLNASAAAYIALRILYNLLYINTETPSLSYARSATFVATTITWMYLVIKAGNVLFYKGV